MKRVNLDIVGATGMDGRTFFKVLEERKFPINNLYLFSSEKTAGTPWDRLLCGTAGGYPVGHCEKVLHHIRTYQKHEPSDRRNPGRTETTDREISGPSYGLLRKEQQNILLTILYF